MNDADQLCNLLQRYARAVDARDLDGLQEIFLPDATIDGANGLQSLDEWLTALAQGRTFPTSMHVLGVPLIDLEADHAALDTYAVVYQLGDRSAGQNDLTLGIRYLDDVTRATSGWRIGSRRAITLWMR